MKGILIAITMLMIILPTNVWSIRIKAGPPRDMTTKRIKTDVIKKNWIRGVMTEINDDSVVINERQYRITSGTIIRYPEGHIVKNINMLKNVESVYVSARIDKGVVKELVVEEIELRH
jgi:hypothetical protein